MSKQMYALDGLVESTNGWVSQAEAKKDQDQQKCPSGGCCGGGCSQESQDTDCDGNCDDCSEDCDNEGESSG